jgi:hypothetical protein
MTDVKLPKGVKRITIVTVTGAGEDATAQTLYRAGGKRKKQSKGLRFFERLMRRQAEAGTTYADTYLARHKRSNRKRRDGWLKDYGSNMMRARRKASKKMRWAKLLG